MEPYNSFVEQRQKRDTSRASCIEVIMRIGDLVIRRTTGRVGIITKVIKMNKDIYYWIYVDDYGKHEHVMLHSVSIRRL